MCSGVVGGCVKTTCLLNWLLGFPALPTAIHFLLWLQVDRQCLTSYVDMKAYCDCDVTADPASYAGGWRCAAGISPAPLAQEQRYCCTRGLQCRIAPAVTAVHAKLRANFWQHKSHVAGYANASASGRLSEECLVRGSIRHPAHNERLAFTVQGWSPPPPAGPLLPMPPSPTLPSPAALPPGGGGALCH